MRNRTLTHTNAQLDFKWCADPKSWCADRTLKRTVLPPPPTGGGISVAVCAPANASSKIPIRSDHTAH